MTADLATAVKPRILKITIEQLRESGGAMLQQHYLEVAQDKRVPLEPDWPTYERMEELGLVLLLGAFVGASYAEAQFVGYSLNFVYPRHLHYSSLSYAQNDVFFVTKSHRGRQCGSIGNMLREETKRLARERGARKVFWHAKERTAMARWLAGNGCKVADLIFSEDL